MHGASTGHARVIRLERSRDTPCDWLLPMKDLMAGGAGSRPRWRVRRRRTSLLLDDVAKRACGGTRTTSAQSGSVSRPPRTNRTPRQPQRSAVLREPRGRRRHPGKEGQDREEGRRCRTPSTTRVPSARLRLGRRRDPLRAGSPRWSLSQPGRRQRPTRWLVEVGLHRD